MAIEILHVDKSNKSQICDISYHLTIVKQVMTTKILIIVTNNKLLFYILPRQVTLVRKYYSFYHNKFLTFHVYE